MPILQFTDESQRNRAVAILPDGLTMGRSPDNDLVIESNFVSAYHAKVHRRNSKLFIKDLSSHNGTFINGLRIKEAPLIDGDEISLADISLTFLDRPAQRVTYLDDSTEIGEDRLYKSHVDSSPLVKTILGHDPVQREETAPPLASQLLLFYKIIEIVNTAIDLQQMLHQIMEILMEVVPAERGYLLLKDEKSGDMLPMAVVESSEDTPDPERPISLSRAITSRAIEEKSTVLIEDAFSSDSNFNPSKSIIALNIRSALCAPLWNGDDITGLLYFDNRSLFRTASFHRDHVDLLSAVGYQVALGVEKFKLVAKVRREEILRANLQRYHSPDVIEMIINHSDQNRELPMGVDEKIVTIVFCDIVGFTKIAEKKQPIEVADFLNEFLTVMTEIVFEYGGTLDKYIGDAVMAIFGAPVSKGQDAIQAVRAAIKMRDTIQERMSFRHPIPFEIRVGINTGRVVAGNFGSHRRMEYTVIGDPVNVAARLESHAGPSQVLIGQSTYELVRDHFKMQPAGDVHVRGRTEPVPCWWVESALEASAPRVLPTTSS